MQKELSIFYQFTFSDGKVCHFDIHLQPNTLAMTKGRHDSPPDWTRLEQNQCPGCSLKPVEHPHCPVAVNMAGIVETFQDCLSYDRVEVLVTTRERAYSKSTTLHEGLSALIGIIMVTSGCPAMERLKPMVRFHLPFAGLDETAYRMISMYLVGQLFRHRRGETADWQLSGLAEIYGAVEQVNLSFADRLHEAGRKDANVNALVNLDCFAKMVPFAVEDLLAEMEGYFAAHF